VDLDSPDSVDIDVRDQCVASAGVASNVLTITSSTCSLEIFFGIITRYAIRRGTFTSVPDLIGAIRAFIDGYNDRCQPFAWTKSADQILAKADRKNTSDTEH
jgi:hypothetical protein